MKTKKLKGEDEKLRDYGYKVQKRMVKVGSKHVAYEYVKEPRYKVTSPKGRVSENMTPEQLGGLLFVVEKTSN